MKSKDERSDCSVKRNFVLFIVSSLLVNYIVTLDNPNIREDDLSIAASSYNLGIYYWLRDIKLGPNDRWVYSDHGL